VATETEAINFVGAGCLPDQSYAWICCLQILALNSTVKRGPGGSLVDTTQFSNWPPVSWISSNGPNVSLLGQLLTSMLLLQLLLLLMMMIIMSWSCLLFLGFGSLPAG
jgi:hypothetical protein